MTNLKRGCNACISAKRRCDRELPQCSRCRRLAKACQYVNKPGQAAIWTGHRTCKLASRTTQQTEIIILPKLAVTPSGGKVMDVDYIDWMSPSRSVFTNLSLSERGVAMCFDHLTLSFLVDSFSRLPRQYAETDRTCFISQCLTGPNAPLVLVKANEFCKTASKISNGAISTHHETIEVELTSFMDVIRSTNIRGQWHELFASAQALILYITVALFISLPQDRNLLATKQAVSMLNRLTVKLWLMAPSSLPHTLGPCEAWIVGESVRRTIAIAHILLHTVEALQHGRFLLQPFLLALPFDARTTIFSKPLSVPTQELEVVQIETYREFTERSLAGDVTKIDEFGFLLLTACKGIRGARKICKDVQVEMA